jgi:hypothetical protein
LNPDTNPYTPPKSNLRTDGAAGGGSKMFSPIQAGVAAFMGGPLAATYVLRKNFLALGNMGRARSTLTWGLILSALIILIIPFIPDWLPNMASSVIYLVVTNLVMQKYQLSRNQIIESDRYRFQSNWLVLLVIVLAITLLIAVAVPYVMALEAIGAG